MSKLTDTAHDAKQLCDALLLRANVNDSGEARVAAMLCLTVCEQFAAVVHLVEGGFSAHTSVMERSMLEELAILLNLVKYPQYLDQIHFDNMRAEAVLYSEIIAYPEVGKDQQTLAALANSVNANKLFFDTLKTSNCSPPRHIITPIA